MQLLMQCHLPEWRCFFLYHDFIMFLITSNKSPEPHEVTSIIIQLVELSQCFCPVRSIWIYRVIRWNHGNHHPKQLLLNFWGFKKKLLKNLHGEVQSWFVRGVSLQQWGLMVSKCGSFQSVHVFFSIYFCINSACNISFLYHAQVCFVLLDAEAKFPAFSKLAIRRNLSVASTSHIDRQALFDALFGRAELCDGVEFLEGNLVAKWFLGPKKKLLGDRWPRTQWLMKMKHVTRGLWGNLPSFSRENYSS